MKALFLLRGLPGAGKSTLAKSIGGMHFEADMYFLDENSEYKFDPTKLRDAHAWCQGSVSNAMILNHTTGENEKIVVSNTFTQEWEMDAYYKLAEDWGYTVFSLIVENRHGGKNTHGVPEDKLQIMKDRFEVKL
jgi:energy-coupling factor transporter ATP-binding protein EcfA2